MEYTKFSHGITIEAGGKGETYHVEDGFTVYGHDTYPQSSVLGGQYRRCWLNHFDTVDEAKENYPTAEVIEGSSYSKTTIPHIAPSWFDPLDAGEVWDDEDGIFDRDEDEW